ncbi:MAG: type II secretion system protein [bacterium]
MKPTSCFKIRKAGGFTLIELLVVISIIALLSSVVLVSVSKARQRAQAITFVENLKNLITLKKYIIQKMATI